MHRIGICLCVFVCLLASGCGSKATGSGVPECGNGDLETGEECDGQDLGESSCESLGLEGGTLACAGDCTFDVTGCTGTADCGNGVREYPEECDATDLAGADCITVGYTGGELSCSQFCTYDVSGCDQTPICGDEIVVPPEQCDGSNLNGQTCESLGLGSGDLECGDDCTFDVSDCTGTADCGNSIREFPEDCDDTDLAGQDCTTLGMGFDGGTLACAGDCSFDTSGCTDCGDGVAEGSEACDASDLAGQDCTTLGMGFDGGTLACGNDCDFDTTGCTTDSTPICQPVPTPVQLDESAGPMALNFNCSDADGDTLTVDATDSSAAPDGGIAFSDNGPNAALTVTITLDPDNDDAGSTGTATFNVSFTVLDQDGRTVTVIQQVTFDNIPPVADAGPDRIGLPGSTIPLDGTGSYDPDGDSITYQWTPSGGAPALDDPTSATPSLTGGACNDVYTYTLVVNDGIADATDTVTVSMTAVGPYVSEQDCTANNECGDLTRPWCTITGGVEAARGYGFPAVYVKEGIYIQGTTGVAVPESLSIDATPGGDPDILGGYTDLASLARVTDPSCDTSSPGTGATVVRVTSAQGIQFNAGTTNLYEMFCVRSLVNIAPMNRKANITISDAEPTIRKNIIDAVSGGVVNDTIGIDIVSSDAVNPITVLIEENLDAPGDGMVFGGDGSDDAIGINVAGHVHLTLNGNDFKGGTGCTDSWGVNFNGWGELAADLNTIVGGDGSATSSGISAVANGGTLDATLTENDIVGCAAAGGPTGNTVQGVYMSGTNSVTVDRSNRISGRVTTFALDAVGLMLEGAGNVSVTDSNTIVGGVARIDAHGIRATGSTNLTVDNNNTVRGGEADSMDRVQMIGIYAVSTPQLVVSNGNTVTGAVPDTVINQLKIGGRNAYGIRTDDAPQITITDNAEIQGGGPRYITSVPVNQPWGAYGIRIDNSTVFTVSGNTLIRGCSPYCGPGDQPPGLNPQPATGAGISVSLRTGAGAKIIQSNGTILGGPVRWFTPNNPNVRTWSVGMEVLGPQNAGNGPDVTIQSNTAISGNVEPDTMSDRNRPNYAYGIRMWNGIVSVLQNTTIQGGRAQIMAGGIFGLQVNNVTAGITAVDNGQIVGNPFDDGINFYPGGVLGIRFHAPGGGTSWLTANGALGALQDIGGGYAGGNSQGSAFGIDVMMLENCSISYNRVWGGVVPGGLLQRGISMADTVTDATVNNNLVEACGPVTGAGTHHPDCNVMFARSEGMNVRDAVGGPTFVYNNLIFGGFSGSGTTGIRVDDTGLAAAAAQVKFYNNYVNAQGLTPPNACGPGMADARAIEIGVRTAGAADGTGLEFYNNIIDGGGRACYRYGVYELGDGGVVADMFTSLIFGHNVWVQVLPGRDVYPAGYQTWGYHESRLGGLDWCLEGGGATEIIQPAGCLNMLPNVPTTDASYYQNREGDPVFQGNDNQIFERPSTLPWSDFRATAAVLQSNGSLSLLPRPLTEDYEGDARSGGVCDVGHDETP